MKICPKCQNKYTDTTLKFCLQDGTELIGGISESDSNPTVSFEDSETLVSDRSAEQITQVRGNSGEGNWNDSQATRVSNVPYEPKSSNALVAVLLTVLIMLVLFSVIGVGAYLYFNQDKPEVAKNSSDGNSDENNSTDNAGIDFSNSTNKDSKTPTTQKTPKTNENTGANQISTPDPEETKQNVTNAVNGWKSQAESLNLEGYMDNYASRVDYYNKNGASKSFVRNDKQKAFSKYNSIKVQLSNMSVSPNSDGKSAVVVFDKEWNFSGADDNSSGKVKQQLKLIKSGEKWLISSEKDLKVYYVNK